MHKKEKLENLRRILGFEKFSKGNEVIFNCKNPHGCNGNHHRDKLSVNLETDEFHCWVCQWAGQNLKKIFRLGDKGVYRRYSDTISEEKTEKKVEYEIPILPSEFISLSAKNNSPYMNSALNYLKSRGIGREQILRYKLGYCEAGEYRHRIIIPSFDENGFLNFFVGRKFFDRVGVPYKHGNFCKDIIFNDYLVDWNYPVTIVEGPFDAIAAGENAIPLQGKSLDESSKLFKKIIEKNVPVYMALDSDARKSQLKLISLLYKYGVEVYDVMYPFKDVAESGSYFREFVDSAKKIQSSIDLVRIRVNA